MHVYVSSLATNRRQKEAKLLKESPKNKCTLACATGERNFG